MSSLATSVRTLESFIQAERIQQERYVRSQYTIALLGQRVEAIMAPQPNDLFETILRLHEENKKEWSTIRTLLLDFNERLVITEQTGKYAEQFRLHLLDAITKVGDKVDRLHELPGRLESLTLKVDSLSTTVRQHDQAFLQVQGGWIVARIVWVGVSALIAFITSYIVSRISRGG